MTVRDLETSMRRFLRSLVKKRYTTMITGFHMFVYVVMSAILRAAFPDTPASDVTEEPLEKTAEPYVRHRAGRFLPRPLITEFVSVFRGFGDEPVSSVVTDDGLRTLVMEHYSDLSKYYDEKPEMPFRWGALDDSDALTVDIRMGELLMLAVDLSDRGGKYRFFLPVLSTMLETGRDCLQVLSVTVDNVDLEDRTMVVGGEKVRISKTLRRVIKDVFDRDRKWLFPVNVVDVMKWESEVSHRTGYTFELL